MNNEIAESGKNLEMLEVFALFPSNLANAKILQ